MFLELHIQIDNPSSFYVVNSSKLAMNQDEVKKLTMTTKQNYPSK
jgi:hypothetical protein